MIPLFIAVFFILISSVKPNTCPDGSICPGADPCCWASSRYMCCPIDGGNCCPDGLHCCAPGYVCMVGNICILPSKSSHQQRVAEAVSTVNELKVSQLSQCPSGTTDCGSSPMGEECCPLPNAVCCSDGQHCCPNGYTCDLQAELCIKNSASDQFPQPIMKTVRKVNVKQPKLSQCPSGTTDCGSSPMGEECCPLPNAVCCSDGQHCCPNGYTCDVQAELCIKNSASDQFPQPIMKTVRKVNVKHPKLSQCPSGTTDCGSSPMGEECCPLPNAVCCSDGQHCCPNGYTCDVQAELCIKNSASDQFPQPIMKTVRKVNVKQPKLSQCPSGTTDCGSSPMGEECCPLPNAVCCSDGQHCCPNGYTCDLQAELCIKNSASDQFQQAIKKVQDVVCPDGGLCADGSTCCMMVGGQYGCCPYSEAVCCSDEIHCCPSNTTCGVDQCYSATGSIPWAEKKPAL